MQEILIPAVSAAGGGLSVAWVAKVMIQNWIKRNDDNHAKWGDSIEKILLKLIKVETQMEQFQRMETMARDNDRNVAVIQTQIAEVRTHLNGLGQKVRGMQAE